MNLALIFGRLQKLLRRRGWQRDEAQDLVQEAFLRMQVYCNDGGEVREPEAFLVRTVLNLAVNEQQSARRRLSVPNPVEDLVLVDPTPSPDEVLAAEQCLERMRRTLDSVSRRTRDVFFMHRLHGLSYAQIAEHFDISVSAIEKHIANAMAALGQEMLRR